MAQVKDPWVDIIPPQLPPIPSVAWDTFSLLGFTLLVIALLLLGVVFYQRPKQRASRTLERLSRQQQDSQIEIKAAFFLVRQALRDGLDQDRLDAMQPPPVQQAAWQTYQDTLTRHCFAAEPISKAELNRVIGEARKWLRMKTAAS